MTENQTISWYCVRSQPKHEHIAAAHLRLLEEVEVYLPRIRFKRGTCRGITWVTEALFPGYLFAKFQLSTRLRAVKAAAGVSGVVQFRAHWPVVEETIMVELKKTAGCEELRTIPESIQPGEAVTVAQGAFRGLTAVVTRVMSGGERVAILMEFLGRQTQVELPTQVLARNGDVRTQCRIWNAAPALS